MRCAVTTVTTVITVAAGAFAPGHLGELTRVVPFELADAVLEEEGGLEKRVRLRALRRRVGAAPVKRLFEVLAGPLGQPRTPGIMFGGYRTVSFDGCRSVKVPDTEKNRAWLGKGSQAGYPALLLMTLAETGTRALLGAVFGSQADGEAVWARKLLPLLDA